jgi:hypothetical protein
VTSLLLSGHIFGSNTNKERFTSNQYFYCILYPHSIMVPNCPFKIEVNGQDTTDLSGEEAISQDLLLEETRDMWR